MKINKVTLCPSCGSEVEKDASNCNPCGYNLKPFRGTHFGTPDYIQYQYQEATKNLKKEEDFDSVKTELFLYLRSTTDDEKSAALIDAEMVMRHLLKSNAKADTVKNLVKLGKRIGKLAESIDAYIQNGGYLNGNFRTTKPTDDNEDPK